MSYSQVEINDARRQVVDIFGGLNRALRISEGEWSETMNLSSDQYPMLSTRRRRTVLDDAGFVVDMLSKGEVLCILERESVDGGAYKLRVGNTDIPLPGAGESLVSMGAYVIVTGCNYWYNTADDTHGSIDAVFSVMNREITNPPSYNPFVLKICPCDADGNELRILYATDSTEAAKIEANPAQYQVGNGDCLANGESHTIKKYHAPNSLENADSWENMPKLIRVEADGIDNAGFEVGDVVDVSGIPTTLGAGVYAENWDVTGVDSTSSLTVYNSRVSKYDDDPNGLRTVAAVGAGYIVLKDLFYTRRVTVAYSAAQDVSIGRRMPDMDYVIECQNRLWGCKYGVVDGKRVNEIYASALGDFKNWRVYDGTSMASYAASVGTDGKWTGAINYNGYPLFFKENVMHKVYVSAYGAHQIKDMLVDGIKNGSWKSACVVNGTAFWAGKFGFYAYDGSSPRKISNALGTYFGRYVYDTIAGGANGKVYFSFLGDEEPTPALKFMCYDMHTGIWHEEDAGSGVFAITQHKDGVYCAITDGKENKIMNLFGTLFPTEEMLNWSCTSGLIGYADIGQKYVSRFVLRAKLPYGSVMNVMIEYDSDGKWNEAGSAKGTGQGTGSYVLPLVPRRCDHFRIKLSGTGEMALYSFAKMYQEGSDVS